MYMIDMASKVCVDARLIFRSRNGGVIIELQVECERIWKPSVSVSRK